MNKNFTNFQLFSSFIAESCDGLRRTSDLAMHSGYQRRTREIADWARSKRRRYIRREDLLAYLAGKSPPPATMIHVTKMPHQTQQHSDHHVHNGSTVDSDLHTFKEALARRPRYTNHLSSERNSQRSVTFRLLPYQ